MTDASRPIKTKPANISAQRLKGFIERVEKLEEERKAIGGDIRDVYSEAKGAGFDVKMMRKLVQLRKMDAADRDEQEAILDVYRQALGMEGGLDHYDSRPVVNEVADKRAVAVLEAYGLGKSYRDIETETGVPKSTVARIVKAARAAAEASANVPRDSDDDDGTAENGTPESGGGRLAGTVVTLSEGMRSSKLGRAIAQGMREAGATVEIGDTSLPKAPT